MPAPSTILDRPEFAILRRLSVEQLRRIKPALADRTKQTTCPLAQALQCPVNNGDAVAKALGMGADVEREASRFICRWDGLTGSYPISRWYLAKAKRAALAEKEGTDARP